MQWRLVLAFFLLAAPAQASPESAALRARAFQHAYNLDYDLATRDMQAAVKADPHDVAAERGLAVIPWLLISFRRGAVTVDDYLGSISKQNVALREPPQELAASFTQHVDRALVLAEAAVKARPRDAEAHYQLGSVVGLQASYVATVEGRVLGGFRAARRAYDAHEHVLDLDARRKDAGLIVGMYRYIVSALSLPLRMLAYVVGFGGGKELGVRMIEEAAAYPGDSQAEARFALVLIYNRDARYDEAQRVLTQLQREYPRNRILWLEAGSTALRAGRVREAHELLTKGLHMLAKDKRPWMFGEEALWLLKRGTARVALGQTQPAEEDPPSLVELRRGPAVALAEADLRRALTLESRKWVTGRAHTELGKLADLRSDRVRAQSEYRQAVALAEQDNDPIGAEQARRWLDTPYRGGVR